MFRFLRFKMRSLTAAIRIGRWRHDVRYHLHTWRHGNWSFALALALPVMIFGFLMRIAYSDTNRVALERQRQQDLACLTRNIYFEARGEPLAGQYAVAEVTLNRVASKRFPDTVCEVVHEQKWDVIRKRYVGAFSWTELDADMRPKKGLAWQRAAAAAQAVYDSDETPRVEGALFYHARSIKPRWS